MPEEQCMKCGKKDDLRTLLMSCFYNMKELNIPFQEKTIGLGVNGDFIKFFTLDVCKECRAMWMDFINLWYRYSREEKDCGSGIFIRHLGATIEVPEEVFKEHYPGIEPVRFIKDKDKNG